MRSTLNRAPLPRDASGRVDLEAVERSLASIAGSTQPLRAAPTSPVLLLERLSALRVSMLAAEAAKTNGHAGPADLASSISVVRRETRSPISPEEPVAAKPITPTDVRGIGRVLLAPVSIEDLEERLSTAAPPVTPPPEAARAEVAVEPAAVEVPGDVDLGSLPPLEPHGSVPPLVVAASESPPPPTWLPVAPTPQPAAPDVELPTSAIAVPAPSKTLSPPPTGIPSRPVFNPFAGGSRSSSGAIPAIGSARPPQPVAPTQAAAVGAVFDEFLGSAPVEPAPRPPPVSVPRATPGLPLGPHRAPSLQVPIFRPASAAAPPPSVPRATTPPPSLVAEEEVIESMDVEDVEVEEIVAPTLSKSPPPPLMSRPPALPPLPPKKR